MNCRIFDVGVKRELYLVRSNGAGLGGMYHAECTNDTIANIVLYDVLRSAGFEIADTQFARTGHGKYKDYRTDGSDKGITVSERFGISLENIDKLPPHMMDAGRLLYWPYVEDGRFIGGGKMSDLLDIELGAFKELFAEYQHTGPGFPMDIDMRYLAHIVSLGGDGDKSPNTIDQIKLDVRNNRLAKMSPNFYSDLGMPGEINYGKRVASFERNISDIDPFVMDYFFEVMPSAIEGVRDIHPYAVHQTIRNNSNLGLKNAHPLKGDGNGGRSVFLQDEMTQAVIDRVGNGMSTMLDEMCKVGGR